MLIADAKTKIDDFLRWLETDANQLQYAQKSTTVIIQGFNRPFKVPLEHFISDGLKVWSLGSYATRFYLVHRDGAKLLALPTGNLFERSTHLPFMRCYIRPNLWAVGTGKEPKSLKGRSSAIVK